MVHQSDIASMAGLLSKYPDTRVAIQGALVNARIDRGVDLYEVLNTGFKGFDNLSDTELLLEVSDTVARITDDDFTVEQATAFLLRKHG